ncbi:hypothetical protein [Streptomyces sp. NPDC018833]|uniref:hypothetical protein n=1 Tax=Streptomyces sp. NPDC018833 TaxID=3365053 RepID=UPI00379C9DBE
MWLRRRTSQSLPAGQADRRQDLAHHLLKYLVLNALHSEEGPGDDVAARTLERERRRLAVGVARAVTLDAQDTAVDTLPVIPDAVVNGPEAPALALARSGCA